MARRMFYADEVRASRAWVRGDTAEHLRRVLRVELGQQFELSDHRNMYLASVSGLSKGAIEFDVIEVLPARRLGASITVFAALVKFDRFEWMLEKCSELGVAAVVPVLAARSDVGLDKAAAKRQGRWARICEESGQQCRRLQPLTVRTCLRWDEAIGSTSEDRFLLNETGGVPLLNCLPAAFERVAILVGPEGGWTELERLQALGCGWKASTLGESILRAETAAIAAVSQIQGKWWSLAAGKE